jgi:hypothetical protein
MRSTPPRRGAPLRCAPMKNGVTAPRFVLSCSCRDEERPARFALASGAGRTRNNGEQASKRAASKATPPSAARSPRTNPPTVAQPRVRAPRRPCKSDACTFLVSPCKSDACRRTHFGPVTVCKCDAHDLGDRSPSLCISVACVGCATIDPVHHGRRPAPLPPPDHHALRTR